MNILRFLLHQQVRHMFDEIDYVLEARNAERFASYFGYDPSKSPGIQNLFKCYADNASITVTYAISCLE